MRPGSFFGVGTPMLAAVVFLVVTAAANPPLGSPAPSIPLVDAWDRTSGISPVLGRPMLVVYEDKDSAALNQALKDDLAGLSKRGLDKNRLAVFPVADVERYNYWPARGIVKKAIQEESARRGTVIYCDWDGHVRSALGVSEKTSNVVLFGRDGRVIFSKAGALSAEERKDLIAKIMTA